MTHRYHRRLAQALLVIACLLGIAAPAAAADDAAIGLVADSGRLTWQKVQNFFCTRERLIQVGAVGLVIALYLLFRAKGDVS